MEREDILKFTNSIILLSKLFTTVEDRFLKQKLHDKLLDFISAFLDHKNIPSPMSHNPGFRNVNNIAKSDDIVQHSGNVAQYSQLNLKNSTNNLLDYLEYLVHITKDNATPLLVAQRNLLKFKLHVLQESKAAKKTKRVLETSSKSDVASMPNVKNLSPNVVDTINPGPNSLTKRKNGFGAGKSNKEQIFNYIKKTPDIRTKEIMSEFSALSGRTVKRSLKELTDEGFLKKRIDGAAVYYTCG